MMTCYYQYSVSLLGHTVTEINIYDLIAQQYNLLFLIITVIGPTATSK